MRRRAATRKNQVKNEEKSKECITSNDDGDKNLLVNNAINNTLGESSGASATSKRVKKRDVIKNSENGVLNGYVENSQKSVVATKRGGKKANKHLEVKQNKESEKVVSESASNGELKENSIESSVENEKLNDAEMIAENPETSEKRNVNEVLMKRHKKQIGKKTTNRNNATDASEGMKPVEKQIQENEDYVNKVGDDDFVNDKKNASGKHGKKGQIDTKSNVTENKTVQKKNLRKNTKNDGAKGSTNNEIAAVGVSCNVQFSKGNNKRKKNESEFNEPEIKHSKSEKGSSDEAQGSNDHVKKELKVVFDHCEEFETINENASASHDTLVSLKNGKGKAGTKRKRGKDDEGKEGGKKAKSAKDPKQPSTSKGSSKKEKIPDVTSLDFSNDSKSSSGKSWNFKISSWNINGIRAWLEKNGISFLHHEKPDVICLQETKCSDDKLPEEIKSVEGYHAYWLSGDKDGYSGVGLLSKEKPLDVEYGIGVSEHDNEGRVITAEYEKFYVVAVYVPNAGRGLVRLDYRMKWDEDFRAYLKKLDEKKPVILCGDLNVAHEEIDLANPKTNKKNAGFTKEEREGFSALLSEGFIDTFRHLYPDMKGAYTFWTYMMNARAKNVGWRLDYFVISKRFDESLCDNVIRKDVFGSDHCPVTLFLSV